MRMKHSQKKRIARRMAQGQDLKRMLHGVFSTSQWLSRKLGIANSVSKREAVQKKMAEERRARLVQKGQ